ncbi:hypothetical protein Misp01_80350 [Microtetraspora sp. NBRC 13810]|uniref:hypothetical protein n=1 Tax=Microtetraspora sp. NBRC 13810 TaxID=3030990 RepID=UPI0024A0A967|nr:hypothetical protein [Microtetraspora sp. NBRC 13810]GLW12907.1 hypothetical protein Misp01_80350 [Microtetraspora sp. NBRC 13810]
MTQARFRIRFLIVPAALLALLAWAAILASSWPAAHGGATSPVGDRWRSWPATRVFPPSVPATSPSGARIRYLLAGVAREARCEDALQPEAARALARLGCVTTLRATYTDSTQTYVVTAGIAVLSASAPSAATPVAGRLGIRETGPMRERPPTVRPAPFPGGAAEGFGERQYVAGALAAGHDRYVVLTAAGYADGRPYAPGVPADPRLTRAARDLAAALHRNISR